MSYELFTMAGSCSMAVHAAMNELGLDAKINIVEKNDGPNGIKSAKYMAMNPRGNVPYMLEDGKGMAEGAAIITYLCDKQKSNLIPQSGFERAKALQWLMFCNATLHPSYSRTHWISTNLPADAQEAALKVARTQIQGLWDYVEGELEKSGNAYLCGNDVTAGDFLLTTIANWNPTAYQFGTKTKALLKSVSARPSYQKALAAESVEYKAAA